MPQLEINGEVHEIETVRRFAIQKYAQGEERAGRAIKELVGKIETQVEGGHLKPAGQYEAMTLRDGLILHDADNLYTVIKQGLVSGRLEKAIKRHFEAQKPFPAILDGKELTVLYMLNVPDTAEEHAAFWGVPLAFGGVALAVSSTAMGLVSPFSQSMNQSVAASAQDQTTGLGQAVAEEVADTGLEVAVESALEVAGGFASAVLGEILG